MMTYLKPQNIKSLLNVLPRRRRRKKIQKLFPSLPKKVIKSLVKSEGWALSPSLLDKIIKINQTIQPRIIVEIGSGVSTQVIQKTQDSKAIFITADEKTKYLNKTKDSLPSLEGIIFIPPKREGGIDFKSIQEKFDDSKKAELVIIDGPSGTRFTEEMEHMLHTILNESSICIVDDTDRKENNQKAQVLAQEYRLEKHDYGDPVYTNQRYTILIPSKYREKLRGVLGNNLN